MQGPHTCITGPVACGSLCEVECTTSWPRPQGPRPVPGLELANLALQRTRTHTHENTTHPPCCSFPAPIAAVEPTVSCACCRPEASTRTVREPTCSCSTTSKQHTSSTSIKRPQHVHNWFKSLPTNASCRTDWLKGMLHPRLAFLVVRTLPLHRPTTSWEAEVHHTHTPKCAVCRSYKGHR